jgi:transcriptional regulator with XRE-family HTH domain
VSKVTVSNQIISERIRVLREIRDFTSKELAKKIGMHPRAYSSYETGEYGLDGGMLAKISQALDN